MPKKSPVRKELRQRFWQHVGSDPASYGNVIDQLLNCLTLPQLREVVRVLDPEKEDDDAQES